jgi:hypothetical protein
MSTGQTLLTILAFVLLSTTLISFYRLLAATGDDISGGQDGILATTITTSYMEVAQGLAFDERTDTSDAAIGNVSALTLPEELGPDIADEDSVHDFNDFDDFDGFEIDKAAGTTGRVYRTRFNVSYASDTDVSQSLNTRTFVKRMDLKTWRIVPPTPRADTLNLSLVLGYFHFD